MEVGGLPACPEEEANGLLTEVDLSPVFPIPPSSLYLIFATDSSLTILILDCYFDYFLLLLGARTASTSQCEMRRSTETGSRGTATRNRGVGKAQGGHSGV